MPALTNSQITDEIRTELEVTRTAFHTLFATLSESDWRRPSHNPGWTNGEILTHMLFGFILLLVLLPLTRWWGRLPSASSKPFAWLLNALTGPFHWFNALGARMQARVFTYHRIGRWYDRIHAALLQKVESINDEEWAHGMYYPTRWDAQFTEFMTLEKLCHYPVVHFNFHREQIAISGGKND